VLGPASDFNLFVLGDMIYRSSSVSGRVAVGADADISNTNIASNGGPAGTVPLTDSMGLRDDLIVGGSLIYVNGTVANGNIVYGDAASIQNVGQGSGNTVRRQNPPPINFAAAGVGLRTESLQLAALPANGQVSFSFGTLTLTGTDPQLNVFNIPSGDLAATNSLQVNAPVGSTVIINVSGTSVTLSGGMTVNGSAQPNNPEVRYVLFNFPDVVSLSAQSTSPNGISGVEVLGSILMPSGTLDFYNGAIDGQVVAGMLASAGANVATGAIHNFPFEGTLPGPCWSASV
jgi:choice-of-anchor A domain-containing protein